MVCHYQMISNWLSCKETNRFESRLFQHQRLIIMPALCLRSLQMAGIRLSSETPQPAYDMINTGNRLFSPFPLPLLMRLGSLYCFTRRRSAQGLFDMCKEFSFFLSAIQKGSDNLPPLPPCQESGCDTPSTNQASSINGTDDEKISHVSPEAVVLKSENERLKSAVEQR